MIHNVTGDMLSGVTEGFLVHGCNCQGAMGSGIARLIRDKWPHAYEEYRKEYDKNGLTLGQIIPVLVEPGLFVVNAMTQDFYQGHARAGHTTRHVDYEAVVEVFRKINSLDTSLQEVKPVVNFPLIGAGLAKGNWTIIETIIDETVTNMEKVLWVLPE